MPSHPRGEWGAGAQWRMAAGDRCYNRGNRKDGGVIWEFYASLVALSRLYSIFILCLLVLITYYFKWIIIIVLHVSMYVILSCRSFKISFYIQSTVLPPPFLPPPHPQSTTNSLLPMGKGSHEKSSNLTQ